MPVMTIAPSKPGHTILCADWTQYPPAAEGDETWLAGCTCGTWCHRGKGPEVNAAWEAHLDKVVVVEDWPEDGILHPGHTYRAPFLINLSEYEWTLP